MRILSTRVWSCLMSLLALTGCIENMPMVRVGHASNPADMKPHLDRGPTGLGHVDYVYRIGKYEVTAGQYTVFLNAVAKFDKYGLYNAYMDAKAYPDLLGCHIQRTGKPGSFAYSVAPGWANRPVNYVSWGDAARFANWMYHDRPPGVQDDTTTEDGSYALHGAVTDKALLTVKRKPNATWVIPSEDEWYKAAYHKNDGQTDHYWDYPTCSDQAPGRDTAAVFGKNANYHPAGSVVIGPPNEFHPTPVGQARNSPGPYGTFDQGGNVAEWNEAILLDIFRGMRGGSFWEYVADLHAMNHATNYPAAEFWSIGFRLAEVSGKS